MAERSEETASAILENHEAVKRDSLSRQLLNVNVGILGHIDSGKTSLVKALSTVGSTSAFDKSPQSKERGITLELGFSAFVGPSPLPEFSGIRYTLVDCPGHASYIRTILGGSLIIDMMILVVDITKGIQTQTAEGLVCGMITTDKLVVVLNKIDLLSDQSREKHCERMKTKMEMTLAQTPFSNSPIVCLSSISDVPMPGTESHIPVGLAVLKNAMTGMIDDSLVHRRVKNLHSPFLMAIDHCFPVKGQGTVMTGTVLRGKISVGQTVEIPTLKVTRKVKSLQTFHQTVSEGTVGDRMGVCVTKLDSSTFERGMLAAPDTVGVYRALLGRVHKIPYFKAECSTNARFHVTLGHATVMASALFFSTAISPSSPQTSTSTSQSGTLCLPSIDTPQGFDFRKQFEFDAVLPLDSSDGCFEHWVLLRLDSPAPCVPGAIFIGSRMDSDINKNACRLAFHGTISHSFDPTIGALQQLRIFKLRQRDGVVDRVEDDRTLIARNLFRKEANFQLFRGLRVVLVDFGMTGVIDSPFGKSGKFRVTFSQALPKSQSLGGSKLRLTYKKFIFENQNNKLRQ